MRRVCIVFVTLTTVKFVLNNKNSNNRCCFELFKQSFEILRSICDILVLSKNIKSDICAYPGNVIIYRDGIT